MQETQVQFLIQEDPTCVRATKPVPQPLSSFSRAGEPQLLKPAHLESVLRNKRSRGNERLKHHHRGLESSPQFTTTREKPTDSNKDPVQPKKITVNSYILFT